MRGTIEYNNFIMKVSKVFEDTWRADRHNDGNKYMWTNFDDVREQIINVRAGDHGAFLITRAQRDSGEDDDTDTRSWREPYDPKYVANCRLERDCETRYRN